MRWSDDGVSWRESPEVKENYNGNKKYHKKTANSTVYMIIMVFN